MSDVRLANVTKAFKGTIAVDDLTLTIEAGEFFSLLGPSGCGKTTTLRMIGGFEDPTSGSVYLGGEEVSNLPPYKRDVNTVFQSYALFPHLTVGENVAYGLKRRKVTKSEIGSRVDDMLKLVDLEGLGDRRPNQLSGGQQQRVALARALVNRPQVLLLDEPLGALDLKLRKQMQLELKRIQSEVGITFIYVTHDQEEAMTMSNRIAVMNAGRLEQIGVVVTVKARTSGLDTNLEDAAQDLGATPLTSFWTVTFPLIFPGILAAGLLVFILSLDDYVVTVFNAGGTAMFPLWIYGASRIGVPPAVNIMGTLIFAIGVVYVIIVLLRERGLLGDLKKYADR